MKYINLFFYETKHAFLGLKRHFLLSLSAIFAIMISLFLIVIFMTLGLHVDHFAQNVQSNLTIHVVLDLDIEDTNEISNIQQQIEMLSNVKEVRFSSKDEELALMVEEKGEAFSIYEGEDNPLANAFFVSIKDADSMQSVSARIEAIDGVASCSYGGTSVTSLIDMLNLIRKVGYAVAALLLLLTLYMIYNTIKTTIFARQEEILIMRAVGASNAFIRIPFEMEGIWLGLLGAIVPFCVVWLGYPKLYEIMNGYLFVRTFSLLPASSIFGIVGFGCLGLGAFIGWFASVLAVSKYVHVKR